MNIFAAVFLTVTCFFGFVVADAPKVADKDLRLLVGQQWAGTLTYMDYRSNKKISIPSNLTVTQSMEDKLSWVFEYQYPDEPKANGKKVVTISRDGRIFNGERVIERTKPASDTLRIVTEKEGEDNDRRALFRYTYLLGAKSFSIKKEVRYEGETGFFERNEYSWKR